MNSVGLIIELSIDPKIYSTNSPTNYFFTYISFLNCPYSHVRLAYSFSVNEISIKRVINCNRDPYYEIGQKIPSKWAYQDYLRIPTETWKTNTEIIEINVCGSVCIGKPEK